MERLIAKVLPIGEWSMCQTCNKSVQIECGKNDGCWEYQCYKKLSDLEDQLESGELVRVVRCKDCMHAEKINTKEYKGIYPNVFNCKMWRGDETKNCWNSKTKEYTDFSTVWNDGYCSEGETKDCGAKMDGKPIKSGGITNV